MRKASEILLLISGILSIIAAFGYLVSMIVFFVLGSPSFTNIVIQGLEDGTIQTTIQGTPAEVAAFMQLTFMTLAIVFIFLLLFAVGSAIVAFLGKKKGGTALYILNIVFGLLSGTILNIVGGIIGLVAKDEKL